MPAQQAGWWLRSDARGLKPGRPRFAGHSRQLRVDVFFPLRPPCCPGIPDALPCASPKPAARRHVRASARGVPLQHRGEVPGPTGALGRGRGRGCCLVACLHSDRDCSITATAPADTCMHRARFACTRPPACLPPDAQHDMQHGLQGGEEAAIVVVHKPGSWHGGLLLPAEQSWASLHVHEPHQVSQACIKPPGLHCNLLAMWPAMPSTMLLPGQGAKYAAAVAAVLIISHCAHLSAHQ